MPIFGICLGHQLLGLAAGHETFKLPFGHRGGNHPVLERKTGRVLVTSQNHGFAVKASEAKEATHVSLYDGTVEGSTSRSCAPARCSSTPRPGPGPHDALARSSRTGSSRAEGESQAMPRRNDIETIALIGSGPIVIGQACEFDYSGCQALKVLRDDGFRTIVINSNPATIMTDPGFADRTYLEPLDVEGVAAVLERERPDALLPTLGGQTALNLAIRLSEEGILDELGIELIGAPVDVIRRAEDRELFRTCVESVGLRTPELADHHLRLRAQRDSRSPRSSGPPSRSAGTAAASSRRASSSSARSRSGSTSRPINQVLVEESVRGWDEFELEVIRDSADNVVIVCSIENLDPMGTHTGDSVTVAPQMTLSDEAYQDLRDASIRIIRAVGVECGGSNIQFARDRDTGEIRVIEMNPRVSRSSALASKATGYPIAKVAAKLAVGYTLDEIPNDLTKTTPASFEPTLDYVVVKFPRFAFEKFPGADTTLGTQMKSVGEAMGIGRTFTEAFLKAMRSRELDKNVTGPWASLDDVPEDVHPWFKREFDKIGQALWKVRSLEKLDADQWLALKRLGLSDADVAAAAGVAEAEARTHRRGLGVKRVFRRVDSCAGEVEAASNYYFSTWGELDEAPPSRERESVVILGSGPNRIGQGIEFDYCCVHAAQSFRALGYDAVMVNCNPETVSTDYDTSDRLYFEPLSVEEVLAICEREQPAGVVIQFGGQTPLKLARALEEHGFKIMGTPFDAVDLAEDRERFGELLRELGVRCPEWGMAETPNEAIEVAERIGYPVLVRPSYVLGGRAMRVCFHAEDVVEALEAAQGRVLIDRFLENAIEIDVDALCDGDTTYVGAVMQHVEEAGVHSGDSSCVLPAPSLTAEDGDRGRRDGAPSRAGARRRRPLERPARRRRRAGVRPRGQPARLADGALREQGDRRQPGAGRVPPRRRRVDRRAGAARRARAAPGQCEGGRPPVRPLPGERSGPRAGDALDRGGHGDCGRLSDGVREGRAGRRPRAAARGHGVPLGARLRQGRRRPGRGCARRPRLQARRDGRDCEGAERRRTRGRGGAEGVRGGPGRSHRRRPHPPRPLRPRRELAAGLRGAHGRLPDPRGRARRARPVHHDALGRRRRRAGDRERARRAVALAAGEDRSRGAPCLLEGQAYAERADACRRRQSARRTSAPP